MNNKKLIEINPKAIFKKIIPQQTVPILFAQPCLVYIIYFPFFINKLGLKNYFVQD